MLTRSADTSPSHLAGAACCPDLKEFSLCRQATLLQLEQRITSRGTRDVSTTTEQLMYRAIAQAGGAQAFHDGNSRAAALCKP